jgi:hypothetical protein
VNPSQGDVTQDTDVPSGSCYPTETAPGLRLSGPIAPLKARCGPGSEAANHLRVPMSRCLVLLILFILAVIFDDQIHTPQTAEYRGDCHRAIYDGWKHSAHASAMESRLFQDALKMTELDFNADARKVCLRCHSPLAASRGDLSLLRKVSWEGITCDYCHSVQDVTTSSANPVARVEFTDVKSGPSDDAVSPVHGTRFSRVHTTSLVCSTCHDYENSLGFSVLTTYSEWQKSAYAKAGQQCQSCHMYGVQGNIVDVRVKEHVRQRHKPSPDAE